MTLLLLLALAGPYAAGRHEVELEGLKTAIIVPEGERKHSMIVLLHGAGDSGLNLSRSLQHWARDGYLVVAPSARDRVWNQADLAAALRIAETLLKTMPIDPERVHAVGFSNGGWNLGPVAFSDQLKCVSAVWIAAGYRGGKVPKWAKKRLGVLALAGQQDANARAAADTVPALRGKVRSAEARFQPNLGHKWPRELIPYMRWWMGTREGRYRPGDDMNFDWGEDVDAAVSTVAERKGRGGVLVYVWSKEDQAPHVQNEVLMDPLVRRFGKQNPAVLLEMGEAAAKLGVKETPALLVLDKKGGVKKHYAGKKIKASTLAKALRAVAPDKSMPKR
ncbi:MAG: hypothetical protein ACYTHK_11880 [Planctomycetota bacterium]|jgi:predicted esterase